MRTISCLLPVVTRTGNNNQGARRAMDRKHLIHPGQSAAIELEEGGPSMCVPESPGRGPPKQGALQGWQGSGRVLAL